MPVVERRFAHRLETLDGHHFQITHLETTKHSRYEYAGVEQHLSEFLVGFETV